MRRSGLLSDRVPVRKGRDDRPAGVKVERTGPDQKRLEQVWRDTFFLGKTERLYVHSEHRSAKKGLRARGRGRVGRRRRKKGVKVIGKPWQKETRQVNIQNKLSTYCHQRESWGQRLSPPLIPHRIRPLTDPKQRHEHKPLEYYLRNPYRDT